MFLLRADESRYGQLFEDMRKAAFVGRYEYPETINGEYEYWCTFQGSLMESY